MAGVLCEHCTGVCCSYVALPIEEPETRSDFDDIRWYLLHQNISIFVEDGDWYINIATRCRYLQPDGRCGTYATRPRICRQYSEDNCDYHSGDYGWELHFTCAEHLDDYVSEHFKNNGKRSDRSQGKSKANSKDSSSSGKDKKRRIGKPMMLPQKDASGVPLPPLEARS